jgi:putative FmdB family regulatory protein
VLIVLRNAGVTFQEVNPMPIYEYQCTSCNYSFEQKQGFDAEPVCTCPRCRNEAKRLFRPAPIIFRGKGFYVTDYPNNGSATTARSKAEETSVTESKKEPEAKPESTISTASAPKSTTE